jgi:hypothetical protein
MKTLILVIAMLLAPQAARAEYKKPMPVPAQGGICPSGFSRSPTSNYCMPNQNTHQNAVPKQGLSPCPPGTRESMQAWCLQDQR